jgi:dihydropteroate synthase
MKGAEDIRWNLRGRLVPVRFPMIMGILNATPDSFFTSSRSTVDGAVERAGRMLKNGAGIIDIGGASSRPGSPVVEVGEEMRRVIPVIEAVHRAHPEAWISVDTWRAEVARAAVEAGAVMVNDIGAGRLDPAMLPAVAAVKVPYVIMHMQGTPATMQHAPHYDDVAAEVTYFLSERIRAANDAGIADVVIDPGFGFGKTTEQNYTLLRSLDRLTALDRPVLVGLSRKRMINELLGTSPEEALNGTTVLNTIALLKGASILRVHDVKEALEVGRLVVAFGRH